MAATIAGRLCWKKMSQRFQILRFLSSALKVFQYFLLLHIRSWFLMISWKFYWNKTYKQICLQDKDMFLWNQIINLECVRHVTLKTNVTPGPKFTGSKCFPSIWKSETHTRTLEPIIYRINPKNAPKTLHFKGEGLLWAESKLTTAKYDY